MKVRYNDDKELVMEIKSKLKENDGYCPCQPSKTKDTICPCKYMRKYSTCRCGLYVPVTDAEEDEDV